MKDPIQIKLTPKEAEIIAQLFSDGDTLTIAELLAALPKGERQRLSRKIRGEIKNSLKNVMTARAYLETRSLLHIQEGPEEE